MKENSPFQPGMPVSPGMFVGRENQIREINRYLKQTVYGRQQSVFLIGDRGLGKTSLASFIMHYAEREYNLLGVHTFLGGVSSLDGLVQKVFEGLLKRSEKESWSKKVRKFFGKNVEEVGLFGVNLKFTPSPNKLGALVNDFPDALRTFLTEIKKERSGLVIILDDINGAMDSGDFANWFKSFSDRVAVEFDNFPVCFLLIGLPYKRDMLFQQQPSLMRIFQILEIERLSNSEIEQFYTQAFSDLSMEVEKDAMTQMVTYCSGLPVMMQEIGDAVFWEDVDQVVDIADALYGTLEASERIGKKYLTPKFYNAVRSERYKSIIDKIGQNFKMEFTKKEIEKDLTDDEKRVFHNFLRKMKDLEIISQPSELPRGAYRFVNQLYLVYILQKSMLGEAGKIRK